MKIVIIGDTILDINHYCNTQRDAPEANIPIYNVINTEYKLGGAANVANNINILDTNIVYISVLGTDNYTNIIKEKLNFNYKLFYDTRITTQKTRLIYNSTIVNRFDIEEIKDISLELSNEILNYIKLIEDINIVIISDYAKGVITNYLCTNLIKYCNDNNIYTIVDPKVDDFLKYKNCFCIKPNIIEGQIMTGYSSPVDIVLILQEKLNCKNIIISCGSDGLYYNLKHIPTEKVNLVDVTGAGDTLISVLSYLLNKTNDLFFSTKYANYMASKSVVVIGNYTINKIDLLKYITKVIYDNETDKIKLLSL